MTSMKRPRVTVPCVPSRPVPPPAKVGIRGGGTGAPKKMLASRCETGRPPIIPRQPLLDPTREDENECSVSRSRPESDKRSVRPNRVLQEMSCPLQGSGIETGDPQSPDHPTTMPSLARVAMWEYTSIHLAALRTVEATYAADPNYMSRQCFVLSPCRALLLDWMMDVCTEAYLHRQTFHMAVNYVDRFLSVMGDWSLHRLQLLGVAALFAACKMEEIYPPDVRELSASTDHSCTPEDILRMEVTLVMRLQWRLTPPTSCEVIALLLERMQIIPGSPKPQRACPCPAMFNSSKQEVVAIDCCLSVSSSPCRSLPCGVQTIPSSQDRTLSTNGTNNGRLATTIRSDSGTCVEEHEEGHVKDWPTSTLVSAIQDVMIGENTAAKAQALLSDPSASLLLLGHALEVASYVALDIGSLGFSPTSTAAAALAIASPVCAELAQRAAGLSSVEMDACMSFLMDTLQVGGLVIEGDGGLKGHPYREEVEQTVPAWDWRGMAIRNSQGLEYLKKVRGWKNCQGREGIKWEEGIAQNWRGVAKDDDGFGMKRESGYGESTSVPDPGDLDIWDSKVKGGGNRCKEAAQHCYLYGGEVGVGDEPFRQQDDWGGHVEDSNELLQEPDEVSSLQRRDGAKVENFGLVNLEATTGNDALESFPERLRTCLPGFVVDEVNQGNYKGRRRRERGQLEGKAPDFGDPMSSCTESDEVDENEPPQEVTATSSLQSRAIERGCPSGGYLKVEIEGASSSTNRFSTPN